MRKTESTNGGWTLPGRVCVLAVAALSASSVTASTWDGASGNWNDALSPGWNGTGVPNAIGATAIIPSASGTLDITSGNVTVGTVEVNGTLTGTRSINSTSGSRVLNLNQDGAGAGSANIRMTSTHTGSRLSFASGLTVNLADNLSISNTSASTGSFAISFTSTITGTGNVTISNVSNSTTSGPITFGGSNTFAGSVLVRKGAVNFTYSSGTAFGNAANLITLGEAGQGSVSFLSTGSSTSNANAIVVAGGTGGTTLLGSTSTSSSNSIFSGGLTLNGDVTLTSSKASADVRYTGAISGSGSITLAGTGETQFGSGSVIANTFTGNTTLTETSSFVLSDNASMKFVIGASGVNNKISGTNNNVLALEGGFSFDLTNAASNGSWTIVDVGTVTETFASSFQVLGGFTQNSNVWTLVDGDVTYTFTEATGVLTAVPEPGMLAGIAGLALLATRRRAR